MRNCAGALVRAEFRLCPWKPSIWRACGLAITLLVVRIALGQINTTMADFAGNSAKIIDYAQRARSAGAELVMFPELSICGYPPRDLVERPWFVERIARLPSRLLARPKALR